MKNPLKAQLNIWHIGAVAVGFIGWHFGLKAWDGWHGLYGAATQLQQQNQGLQQVVQFRPRVIDSATGIPIATGPDVMPTQPDDKTGQVTIYRYVLRDGKIATEYSETRCTVAKAPIVPKLPGDWACTMSLPAAAGTGQEKYVATWAKAKP